MVAAELGARADCCPITAPAQRAARRWGHPPPGGAGLHADGAAQACHIDGVLDSKPSR